jgi:hypothetical protein
MRRTSNPETALMRTSRLCGVKSTDKYDARRHRGQSHLMSAASASFGSFDLQRSHSFRTVIHFLLL